MITNGFSYLSLIILIAALITFLPVMFKGDISKKIFSFAPPVVLIYIVMMILCSVGVWDTGSTAATYQSVRNPVLYSMVFLMLLRCDLRKIMKLGPRMLLGFFLATLSIGAGFVVAFCIFKGQLGADAWKSLGALCGSWMGGGGNMLAISAALDVGEGDLAYALVMDSVCATFYVIFLLWVIGFADKFNAWTKADTAAIDEVGETLRNHDRINENRHISYQEILLLLGVSLGIGAIGSNVGAMLADRAEFFDATTWTVLLITLFGVILALTPLGSVAGTEQLSNTMLYVVIALIASRADISAVERAHIWLLAGVVILLIHLLCMTLFAKIFKIDIFTCAVASLANIGGTATAPVLAGAYSNSLVPVGVIMALLGYVVGTGGGLIVASVMSGLG